jgi:hypothetical protein
VALGRRAARFRALVQDHIPEQVLAAGHVTDTAANAGFSPNSWIGVTATRVYAFAAERGDVGELIGVWDRSAVTVTTSPRLVTTRLSLRFAGAATAVKLEAHTWGAGNRPLLRYLLDSTRR